MLATQTHSVTAYRFGLGLVALVGGLLLALALSPIYTPAKQNRVAESDIASAGALLVQGTPSPTR